MSSGFISLENIHSIAIGNFDGIHLGHQQLLRKLDDKSGIVVIENNHCCLTPGVSRLKYVNLPVFFYHLFKIKHLSATEFIQLLQEDFPHLKKVIVGYDFSFGHQKSGDAKLLQKYFEVEVIDQYCMDGVAIHSKEIRHALQKDYELAKRYLGREYEIEGFHIKGQGVGAKSLVATINIDSHYCFPKEGVYKSITTIAECEYESVSFVGHRKSTDNTLALETHLIDQNIELIDSKVSIEFQSYIRENKKFDSLQLLKKQIEKDIEIAKSV